ncbi:hypothetical protein ACLOJK_021601 [Asimina triloba]
MGDQRLGRGRRRRKERSMPARTGAGGKMGKAAWKMGMGGREIGGKKAISKKQRGQNPIVRQDCYAHKAHRPSSLSMAGN